MRLPAAAALALLTCLAPSRAQAQNAPPATNDQEAQQRAILMELYDATGGPSWQRHDGWGSSKPVCQWAGVECSLLADGLVGKLELARNGLRGGVPAALGRLPYLVLLDLSWNALTGTIPADLTARVDGNELELRLDGNPMGDVLSAVTVQTHAVTGICYGDIEFRIAIDAVKDQATYEALRCNTSGRPKRNEDLTYCIRSTARAPSLAIASGSLEPSGPGQPHLDALMPTPRLNADWHRDHRMPRRPPWTSGSRGTSHIRRPARAGRFPPASSRR